ncbi:MAG: protein kinase, partial [Bacteroidota bacterium]
MTTPSDRWRRIEALFEAVHALPPGERAAVLDREGAEGDLRAEVETLLDAHDAAGGFLMGDDRVAGDARLADGDRLGPYRIAGVLGQGGMGTVYRGVRDDGQFERAVALKVLRAGHGNVPRFLNERQILARLDHPGIARLYDGGVTAEGQPYFALELVDGE